MSLRATVADVISHGYAIGPPADHACLRCTHTWGQHVLVSATVVPVEGGDFHCPECLCVGTWKVTTPDQHRD